MCIDYSSVRCHIEGIDERCSVGRKIANIDDSLSMAELGRESSSQIALRIPTEMLP